MREMNDGSKYVFKLTAVIIVVIINIIALIAVITTVGGTLKNLKKDLASGKIVSSQDTQSQTQYNEQDKVVQQNDFEDENELDFGGLLKIVMADKSVRKSIILMVIALVLLGGAIFILVRLK